MWEDRYKTPDYLFGKAPAAFMTAHADLFEAGQTALSIADGEGRNSVYLAERGLEVTALEFAPSALAKARDLAREKAVSVDFREADVMSGALPSPFDIVLGVFIQFMGPAPRAELFERMKDAVKPGGLMLLHGYTPKQLEFKTGGPPFAENMYTEALLESAFKGWGILENRSYEATINEGRGHSGQSALIDFIACKPA